LRADSVIAGDGDRQLRGRTRSIIGTQSLRNAGLPNPVYALRNGTIGWTLAGFDLERGQQRRYDADFRAQPNARRR
jgi:3-mercaptopyruvate sulfurtransferase SseA